MRIQKRKAMPCKVYTPEMKERRRRLQKERREANIVEERAKARNYYHRYKKFQKLIRSSTAEGKRYYLNISLKSNFGITLQDFEEMVKAQNNLCAICLKPEKATDRNGNLRRLSIDHCHKTEKVRGLLCANCNNAIGLFHEEIDTFKRAIEYLSR